MDSLSQITLGAAVGELLLGKKIGNRAMVWGAVAGTVPDLDVFANLFLNDLQGLLFHRGITHSILFCVIGALFFGSLVPKLYSSKFHRFFAIFTKLIASIVVLLILNIQNLVHFRSGSFSEANYVLLAISSIVTFVFFAIHIKRKYLSGNWIKPKVSKGEWQWMIFWVLFTHIILDCFTLYGTQIFAPFSDYKVAWGTIAVADPLYTVPFLLFLLAASFFRRDARFRSLLNNLGLSISCFYLAFTIFNKTNINSQFEHELSLSEINAIRYSTSATLLNNILWTCTAESEYNYYIGEYSLLDEVPVNFHEIEKNHHLLKNIDSDPTIKSLRWFSDDYFCITESDEGLYFHDLRFGMLKNSDEEHSGYVMTFLLTESKNEGYTMSSIKRGPKEDERENFLKNYWKRILGNKSS